MDANLISAIESVERLKDGFAGLFAIADAVKAGALDAQTLAERKAQLAQIEASIAEAKKEEAVILADIDQHRDEAAEEFKAAEAEAAQVVAEAKAKAAALLAAAEASAQATRKSADEDVQASLDSVTKAIEAKAVALKDLNRQVAEAEDTLASLQKDHAAVAAKIDALKASAAALLA